MNQSIPNIPRGTVIYAAASSHLPCPPLLRFPGALALRCHTYMALLWGHARVALQCECSRVVTLKCDECVALLLSHALAALRSPKLSAQVTLACVPKKRDRLRMYSIYSI